MKIISVLVMAALLSACSALGYRSIDHLKSEAKYRVDKELDRDAVLAYRDAVRAMNDCVAQHRQLAPFRAVVSSLDRTQNRGAITLTHQERPLAHYEFTPTGADKTRVVGWWSSAICTLVY